MASTPVSIDKLLEELCKKEGGYVNHPHDRGGPTNFGITQLVARAYGYNGDMRNLPFTTAMDIYRKQYWTQPNFDRVATIYPRVAAEMFDTGVNMGPKTASKFLQVAVNLLNRGGVDFGDIGTDGDIGNITLYALRALKAKRGAGSEVVLLRLIEGFQVCRYADIATKNPSQESFMYGWVANRVGGHV